MYHTFNKIIIKFKKIKVKNKYRNNASRLFKSDDHVNIFQCFVCGGCWVDR